MLYVFVLDCRPCTLCVHSEGWSDPHITCRTSVAANWISLASQCWDNKLFNISVAFSGTGAGAQGDLWCLGWSWRLRLTSLSDPLGSFVFVPLFPSCSPLFLLYSSCSPSHLSLHSSPCACPHFNSAEVKRWWGEKEVSWWLCFAVNDGKLQCRRQ